MHLSLFKEGRPFYKKLIRLAGPIATQNLLVSSLAMVDTLMIGHLGATSIAAVGLGALFFFLITLFFYGVASGSAIFVSQFWGRKNIAGIRRTIGIALLLSETAGFLFAGLAIFSPEIIMRIFTPDQAVIEIGSIYLKFTGISYIFSGITLLYSLVLRSINEAKLPLISSIIVFFVNTILNYLFIFGHLGFPVMGVKGAALATTISRFLEMVIIITIIYKRRNAAAGSLRQLLDFNLSQVRKYLKTTVPVIINEFGWAVGAALYKMIYARMGTDVIAAISITENVYDLFFSFLIGSANACAIMIGNEIGEKNFDTAQNYAVEFTFLSIIFGIAMGLLLAGVAPFLPYAFNIGTEIKQMVMYILLINAFFTPAVSLNLHYIIGILRGGGDTTYAFLIDIIVMWIVGIPLAYFSGLILHKSILFIIILIGLEEIFSSSLGIIRMIRKKWINNLTEDIDGSQKIS